MSVLFNQTNIAPGTGFSTGGLTNPVEAVVFQPMLAGSNSLSDTIYGSFYPYTGSNELAVYNSSTNSLGPLQLGGYVEVQATGNITSTALWRTLYGSDNITFVTQDTGVQHTLLSVDKPTNTANLSNIGTMNGSAPLLFKTTDTPLPINMVVQAGRDTYTGGPTRVGLPVPYTNYMFIQITQTGNDSTPDGIMYYTNTDLTAFTVSSTGAASNVQFVWTAFGW